MLIQCGIVFSALAFESCVPEEMINDAAALAEWLVLHSQQIVSHCFAKENHGVMITHHIIVQRLQDGRKLRFAGPSFI